MRTDQVKRTAKELMKRFPDKFSDNFDGNKLVVGTLLEGSTVKIRNQIAGYITRSCRGSDTETEEDIEATEKGEEENKQLL